MPRVAPPRERGPKTPETPKKIRTPLDDWMRDNEKFEVKPRVMETLIDQYSIGEIDIEDVQLLKDNIDANYMGLYNAIIETFPKEEDSPTVKPVRLPTIKQFRRARNDERIEDALEWALTDQIRKRYSDKKAGITMHKKEAKERARDVMSKLSFFMFAEEEVDRALEMIKRDDTKVEARKKRA